MSEGLKLCKLQSLPMHKKQTIQNN
jgi:hypothetical protein